MSKEQDIKALLDLVEAVTDAKQALQDMSIDTFDALCQQCSVTDFSVTLGHSSTMIDEINSLITTLQEGVSNE